MPNEGFVGGRTLFQEDPELLPGNFIVQQVCGLFEGNRGQLYKSAAGGARGERETTTRPTASGSGALALRPHYPASLRVRI